jgi:hypothetical protein
MVVRQTEVLLKHDVTGGNVLNAAKNLVNRITSRICGSIKGSFSFRRHLNHSTMRLFGMRNSKEILYWDFVLTREVVQLNTI